MSKTPSFESTHVNPVCVMNHLPTPILARLRHQLTQVSTEPDYKTRMGFIKAMLYKLPVVRHTILSLRHNGPRCTRHSPDSTAQKPPNYYPEEEIPNVLPAVSNELWCEGPNRGRAAK